MFGAVTLRGVGGTITYGYLTAAEVRTWTIRHHLPDRAHPARWTLTATFARADTFQLTRRPLLFSAPRIGTWPLRTDSIQVGATQLEAALYPPEKP